MTAAPIFTEWFWSKTSAQFAVGRIAAKGYRTVVRYAMRADGSHDWLVEAFRATPLAEENEMTAKLIDAWNKPIECPYCGAMSGLRVRCDGGGYIAPEYTCEACFTGYDDGPDFDDLPAPEGCTGIPETQD